MARVILVLATGPGFPSGSPDHRYEMEVALDAAGRLDAAAWRADPAPWPVLRFRPGAPPRRGDVQYDEETGWSLRFPPEETRPERVEALISPGMLRPGEYLTVRVADGVDYGYRIVSIG